jgi:predicted HNH restriction endonuclease
MGQGDVQPPIAAWVFQGNPDRFDVDGYLAAHSDVCWRAVQHRDAMKPGQTVYLWRNAGDSKRVAGVVAVGILTDTPTLRPDDPEARRFWVDPNGADEPAYRVAIRIVDRATAKGVIKADWLADDPVCSDLPNLRMHQPTNHPLGAAHAERLARLWANTGRDFDRLDLLEALNAYDLTFGGAVSQKAGQPVALAAIRTGRAVTSIYAKVMNFRALDSRVAGAGQANGGEATDRIWGEFFNGSDIDRTRLAAALAGLQTPGSEPVSLASLEAEADRAAGYSVEGRRRLVTHFRIERDRRVVEDAKAAWFVADPMLRCHVCRVSFAESYGQLGEGFIEAHHIEPLGDRQSEKVPTVQDFVPLCANCHRMIHRREGVTLDDLAAVVESRKGVANDR